MTAAALKVIDDDGAPAPDSPRDKKNREGMDRSEMLLRSRLREVVKSTGYHGEVVIRVIIRDGVIQRAVAGDEQSVPF